jgi:hypothetical protein
MALNLSTLTSSATSGDVLAEALTTADFLENVPVLRNLARGSQKGGDAKQDVALNQPKALPLIDGDGYLYLSGVSGNNAIVPQALGMSNPWTIAIEAWVGDPVPLTSSYTDYCILGSTNSGISIRMRHTGSFEVCLGGFSDGVNAFRSMSASALNLKALNTFNLSWNGTDTLTVIVNGTTVRTGTLSSPASFGEFRLGERAGSTKESLLGYYKSLVVTESGSEIVNIDFTATNVRHGDTKFACATGQVVTINQSGNDPATVIKKPVLRFANQSNDTTAIGLKGLFNQTITDGYLFAAFSVLGDGGENFGRILGLNAAGGIDSGAGGVAFRRNGVSTDLMLRYNQNNLTTHSDFFDDERGDYLLDVKVLTGSQKSKVNNADLVTGSITGQLNALEFSISSFTDVRYNNAAIDLEFLALFPASITDAQADDVRNYINNRNNVFDLKDGFGYYFFDAQKAPAVPITTGSSSWNGRIVGSDLGDSDRYLTQGTTNDAPVGDGYVVTFADNTDHLDIPSTTQAGWQVVGTSLGTFAYRVDNDAVTELNLLGNAGNASYRKAGDLYGVILLPESATGADIEAARKLLIDRGAADGVTGTSLSQYFRERADIVDFHNVDTSNISSLTSSWSNCSSLTFFPLLDFSSGTNFYQTWFNCSSLKSFPLIDASSGTNFYRAWRSCISLNDFAAIDARNGTSFQEAWQNCSSLTSFPAGAKLGTEASGVNFASAWQSSGLTSFSTPLPTATLLGSAWRDTPLTSFESLIPMATRVNASWRGTSLSSFSTPLPKTENLNRAWLDCTSLTDFSADVFTNWNPALLTTGVFNLTWDGCTALTAQSVENILVSIDASGKYATTTGASGGSALGDAGIDIDYNVATGSLSAATNSAVTSLKSKGWSIFINSVEQ